MSSSALTLARRALILSPRRTVPSVVSPATGLRKRWITVNADGVLDPAPRLETPDDWTQFQHDHGFQKDIASFFSNYGSTQNRDNSFQPHHTLHRPRDATNMTLSTLVAVGAHMGHAKALMNANFLPYVYGVRAGITIINLDYTVTLLRRAANLVRAVASNGGSVVFVGTRTDLRATVQRAASRMKEQGFHVGERWLPGTFTNSISMFGEDTVLNDSKVIPDLVIFLNPLSNLPAIRECAVHHVPTIGIIDSNADPRIIMYPIPANDENPKTAEIIAGVLSIAGREGMMIRRAYAENMQEQQDRQTDSWNRRDERIDLDSYNNNVD